MGTEDSITTTSLIGYSAYLKLATGAACLTTEIKENVSSIINPVYPNPTTNEFAIDILSPESIISVYDYTGKLVGECKNINPSFHFGKEYPKGVYFVSVRTGEQIKTIKVVKT